MKHFMRWLRRPLRNERGEITFFACFFVVGVVMLISFLLLYASVRINCINIRNGAKMELNNLSATIYADTYRSQRETNFEEYLRTLYSSSDYTEMLESTVAGGLASKIPLSTDDYQVSGISLKFNVVGDRVEYIFYCDVEFYVRMFGHNYPITRYDSISGEELSPYRRLSAGCIKTYVGGYKPYQVIVHQNIPVRSIGIEITPAYYEDYLKKQYPEEYRNPIEAFREIDQTTEFPEMYRLLSELQSYRGTGIAAKLYYESKVAEALSLVVEYQKKRSVSDHKLASQDLERIQTVAAYLSDHYAGELPIERLAQIACMGTTKLKSSFKKVYGCTITEYIQQRRMSQAEYLLAHTDLQIGQIAQTIGYSTSSRFAELFRRSTGLLPLEYRKMAKRK